VIVDTSALTAVLRLETDSRGFVEALLHETEVVMSAGTYLEAGIVIDRSRNPRSSRLFDHLVRETNIEIVAVTLEQARIAREAYRDFGKGSGHPAALNFGDCFAYALAMERNESLLYKGNDFVHTDVRSALEQQKHAGPVTVAE
jgi:ribonuclease VapC